MCGIVGYVGDQKVVPVLIDGLGRLEYRGYDSAGVVVLDNGKLETVKAKGKLECLRQKLAEQPLAGSHGLGHTRWATHGVPSERNAHPMVDSKGRVALIHNGIIENFLSLKQRLVDEGWGFVSDTDTEVIANLVSSYLDNDLRTAVALAVAELEGMYAIAAVSSVGDEREIVAARQGPPLVLGVGEGEQFLASDPTALLAHTREIIFLENGDVARLRTGSVEVWDRDGATTERPVQRLDWDPVQAEKGGYKHFMLKEIHEQPQAVQDTFAGRVDFEEGTIGFDTMELDIERLGSIERLQILACGTSWHAGLVGKFMLEELTGIPVEVDYGSEYRYRDPIVGSSVLALGISQSGETADTVSAIRAAREKGAPVVSICNVLGSQLTRISDGIIYTHAGPEIGVASTKAFTTQLTAIYLFGLWLRQELGPGFERRLLDDLAHLPMAMEQAVRLEGRAKRLAREYFRAEDFLYLGRGINYPIALEGADLPVVGIATGDRVFEKVLGNLQEVKARDGVVIALADRTSDELEAVADRVLQVPRVSDLLQPIVNVVPLQLLAYFIGVRRGCDVDQPRNLAKSVTVE